MERFTELRAGGSQTALPGHNLAESDEEFRTCGADQLPTVSCWISSEKSLLENKTRKFAALPLPGAPWPGTVWEDDPSQLQLCVNCRAGRRAVTGWVRRAARSGAVSASQCCPEGPRVKS